MNRHGMGLDPLSLSQIGLATWLTQLVVAHKFAQALGTQGALVMNVGVSPSLGQALAVAHGR